MNTTKTMHEPSAWLRVAVAQILERIDTLGIPESTEVVTTLGQTGGRDDRTCDRCGTYVPEGPAFYVDMLQARPRVRIVIGLCQTCRDLERGGRQ